MKPWLSVTTIVVLLLVLLAPTVMVWAQDEAQDTLQISNEYIRIVANIRELNTGRFSLGTTGGDPDRDEDRNKHLIYGGDDPWTSYTTVRVGNQNWVFGGSTNRRAGRDGLYGDMIEAPVVRDGAIVSVWRLGPVEVTQKLSLARSTTTGLMDTARIEYQVHNTDNEAHLVGLRLMLDTMLGENDGAPFRVDDQAILTDTVFYSHNMPEFWQAFDSLSNPQVMAQGTLRQSGITTPDRVYFTNWGSLADDLWNFDFQPGRDFTRRGEFELDSAMAMFWDPIPLQPGTTRTFVTHYGLGGVTIAPGDLSLGVTSPAQIIADPDHRQSFPIIAYIQNTGQGEAREVTADIRLPRGLELVEGSLKKDLGNLDVGETIQTSWQIIPRGELSGTISYEVIVDAINSEANKVSRNIEVVSPAKLQVQLRGPEALRIEDERLRPVPIAVEAELRNVGGMPAHSIQARIEHPIGLVLAQGDRAIKYPVTLGPGESTVVRWFLEPTGVSGNLPYSLRVESSAGQQVLNNFVLIPGTTPRVWVGGPTGERSDTVRPGDYFSVAIWATNIPDFQRASFDVYFNPDVAEIVGRTLDISRGTLFVDDRVQPPVNLSWTMPNVDNQRGRVLGAAGDRGEERPLPLAFGTLITIHFRAKAPGYADVLLQNVNLYDTTGQVPSFEVIGRDIVVKE